MQVISPIEADLHEAYFVLPIWSSYTSTVKSSKASEEPTKHPDFKQVDKEDQVFLDELERLKRQEQLLISTEALRKRRLPQKTLSPIPTSRINSIHPSTLILGDPQSAVQTKANDQNFGDPCFFDLSRRTTAIQDSESLDSCRFALWKTGTMEQNRISNVAEILKKFDFVSVKTASTPIETHKPLVKGKEASDVDVNTKDFPSNSVNIESLVSDYARANLDRIYNMSCQVLDRKLFLGKCKKQTIGCYFYYRGRDILLLANMLWASSMIQNQMYITAKVAGKPVSISEASIRSDLLLMMPMEIDSLPYSAIYDAIQRWVYEGDLTVQTRDQWESEGYIQRQGNKTLKAQIKKLKKKAKPVITHHRAWMKSVSLKQRLQKNPLEETIKEKGSLKLKRLRDCERPRHFTRSLLTLKPLLKIDPKDKGKKKIEEEDKSETESEGIPEAEKKFKQLARDEEMARKLQEDWETKEERKRLAEEEATKTALSDEYDFIQARIEADRLLALRLQDEEREQFTMEEREKFLHDTIAAQRRFLVEQRAIAIRNKPPTRTQLRNQMMTYLKYVGNKKHSDLKSKTFKEIQAMYEKVKRFDESFTTVGSTKDERRIKEMNEGVKDTDQKRLKEEDIEKVPAKQDVKEQGAKKRKGGHIKMIAGKKKRPQLNVDSEDEHRKCLKIVTFEGALYSEIIEKKLFIAKLNKVSSPDGDYLVIYRANGNFRAFNYLMEVLHIFNRQDLFHLYNLVKEQYSEVTLEGIELILWGDLKIMMDSSTEENNQIIHMLVERRYPLSKDLLQRMLDLGLEVEREIRTSRNNPVVSKASATSSSTTAYLPEITALTNAVKAMLLQKKTPSPAPGNTFNAYTATGPTIKEVRDTLLKEKLIIGIAINRDHPFFLNQMCRTIRTDTIRIISIKEIKILKLRLIKLNPSGSGSLPSNTIANPRGDLKAITTRSGVSYDGPTIPPTSSPLPKEVEREPEATKDKVQTTSTAHVQPPVVQVPIPEPDLSPKPNPKPSIPYPSRINDQKL
ncbi:hypothetical protein Tco_0526199 [Tanacetum coccineum]